MPIMGPDDEPVRLVFDEEVAWNDEGQAAFYAYKARVDVASEAAQQEMNELFESLEDQDPMTMLKAVEDGAVEIMRRCSMEASRAAADYYDAERLRQTGLQDGFKAEVKEFTEEDERAVREMIRQNFQVMFDPGSD